MIWIKPWPRLPWLHQLYCARWVSLYCNTFLGLALMCWIINIIWRFKFDASIFYFEIFNKLGLNSIILLMFPSYSCCTFSWIDERFHYFCESIELVMSLNLATLIEFSKNSAFNLFIFIWKLWQKWKQYNLC
jgi:hypothetical protein